MDKDRKFYVSVTLDSATFEVAEKLMDFATELNGTSRGVSLALSDPIPGIESYDD